MYVAQKISILKIFSVFLYLSCWPDNCVGISGFEINLHVLYLCFNIVWRYNSIIALSDGHMCFVTSVKCFFCQSKISITHSLTEKSASINFLKASKVENAPCHHKKNCLYCCYTLWPYFWNKNNKLDL